MANTKNYSLRERILDHYLSRGWYSRKQLEDACNRELEIRGELPITSRQTIQNDLLTIENKYHIIIETKKIGRIPHYRYQQDGFSIYKSELSEDDYQHLAQAIDILNRFRGMPQFEWIEEMDVRFNTSIMGGSVVKSVVGFEDTSYNKGMDHFTSLFNYIKEHTAIDISYKSFKMTEPRMYSISPYYLKQFNNRWFLFGKTQGYKSISVFPLDRIERICNVGKEYEECDIDFDEYFEDIIGVSKPDNESEIVEIWFSKDQLNYIETKPIHGSQRIIHRDDTGGVVQLDIIINYELEQLILSHGEKAEVLFPKAFRDKIRARIEECIKKY